MADEAGSWNDLHARYEVSRIDHGQLYSTGAGVYTNGAESFFSRMRRAEIGHHHHVAGAYLVRYAQESAWREDYRARHGVQAERGFLWVLAEGEGGCMREATGRGAIPAYVLIGAPSGSARELYRVPEDLCQ